MKTKILALLLIGLIAVPLVSCEASDPSMETPTTVPPTEEPLALSPAPTLNPGIVYFEDYPNIPDFGAYMGIPCANESTEDSTKMYTYEVTDLLSAFNEKSLVGYYDCLLKEGFSVFEMDNKDLKDLGVNCLVGMSGDNPVSILIGPFATDEFVVMITADDGNQPSYTPKPTPSVEPTPTPAPTEVVTMGQRNALSKAHQYLSIMAFSHSGLVKQLEYEGYSTEEATYGADNCGADWNEQALKSAKNYLSTMAFSHSGLIKQLEYEGFTTEQATYGADNCGTDWNEQAAKKAQNYVDIMSFSRQGLIDQLKFDGFTQSQAEYGVSAIGY